MREGMGRRGGNEAALTASDAAADGAGTSSDIIAPASNEASIESHRSDDGFRDSRSTSLDNTGNTGRERGTTSVSLGSSGGDDTSAGDTSVAEETAPDAERELSAATAAVAGKGASDAAAAAGEEAKHAAGNAPSSTEKAAASASSSTGPATNEDKGIHVFVSTDETDLRPIAVVINSTLVNAREPWRVDFHLVVPEKNVAAMRKKLLPLFPSTRIEISSSSPSSTLSPLSSPLPLLPLPLPSPVSSPPVPSPPVPSPPVSSPPRSISPSLANGTAAATAAAPAAATGAAGVEGGAMRMGWWEKLGALITYKEGSGARKELVSIFNFLPFYLPQMAPQFRRIVYLDADIVVVGDIGELADVDMEGRPVAAVQDCMQTFKTYFDFDQLVTIQARNDPSKPWMPSGPFDKTTCVFNRGVLLMDVQRWLQSNISGAIEWWMAEFSRAPNPLYKFGMSQPPFLLTIYDRYKKLDRIWNTRGLGRDRFGEKERDYLATIGLGRPPKRPFVSFWADSAKILHFNGKFKPWRGKRERREGEEVKSVCGEKRFDCAKLWWQYLSPEAEAELRRKGKGKKVSAATSAAVQKA
ncbi:unnamed protein product [Closterium sp. Yama58-4]|nr:unnamed protein product [Closterium sp. Yama58-4]